MKLKLLLVLVVILIVAGVSFFLYSKNITNTTDAVPQINSVSFELVVPPQTPTDAVTVDQVTMSVNGYLVARGIDGGRLDQVIEISKYLEKGQHKNVKIPLGDFYNGEELIVMIYEDEGDKVFNDIDLPALDGEGRMIARYVKTGEPLPTSITEADASGVPAHTMPGAPTMVKVRYTDTGFIPSKIEVSAGTMVEFVNESNMEMWVASDVHPSHEKLPTFDQFKSFKKGGLYRYVFDKAGAWEYHDHINPSLVGIVTVR